MAAAAGEAPPFGAWSAPRRLRRRAAEAALRGRLAAAYARIRELEAQLLEERLGSAAGACEAVVYAGLAEPAPVAGALQEAVRARTLGSISGRGHEALHFDIASTDDDASEPAPGSVAEEGDDYTYSSVVAAWSAPREPCPLASGPVATAVAEGSHLCRDWETSPQAALPSDGGLLHSGGEGLSVRVEALPEVPTFPALKAATHNCGIVTSRPMRTSRATQCCASDGRLSAWKGLVVDAARRQHIQSCQDVLVGLGVKAFLKNCITVRRAAAWALRWWRQCTMQSELAVCRCRS